jgi:hypothetical protein
VERKNLTNPYHSVLYSRQPGSGTIETTGLCH